MLLIIIGVLASFALGDGRKNLIFFMADDFRPQMNAAYNQTYQLTPNLDKFASESLVFTRAYCQQSVCNPTRSSLLTGRSPMRTRVFNNTIFFRDASPEAKDWVTFPGGLKERGYVVLAGGKVSHWGGKDGNRSWSVDVLPYYPFVYNLKDKYCPNGAKDELEDHFTFPDQDSPDDPQDHKLSSPWSGIDTWCNLSLDHSYFYDNHLTNWTINTALPKMVDLVHQDTPVALFVGFLRPHVPYRVPQEFWDLYPDVHPSEFQHVAENYPPIAYHQQGYYHYPDSTNGVAPNFTDPMPSEWQVWANRGYRASISWMDYNFGLVLAEIDRLGLTDSTLVTFIGDHGYSLERAGEMKETINERGSRVPTLIRAPWLPKAKGRTDAIVSHVDLMATVFDLLNLTMPNQTYDSRSYASIVRDPTSAPPFTSAFTQFPRCYHKDTPAWAAENMDCPAQDDGITLYLMGYAVRTEEWRAAFYMNWDPVTFTTDWSKPPNATEFYDHRNDNGLQLFGSVETVNLANDPTYKPAIDQLFQITKTYYEQFQ